MLILLLTFYVFVACSSQIALVPSDCIAIHDRLLGETKSLLEENARVFREAYSKKEPKALNEAKESREVLALKAYTSLVSSDEGLQCLLRFLTASREGSFQHRTAFLNALTFFQEVEEYKRGSNKEALGCPLMDKYKDTFTKIMITTGLPRYCDGTDPFNSNIFTNEAFQVSLASLLAPLRKFRTAIYGVYEKAIQRTKDLVVSPECKSLVKAGINDLSSDVLDCLRVSVRSEDVKGKTEIMNILDFLQEFETLKSGATQTKFLYCNLAKKYVFNSYKDNQQQLDFDKRLDKVLGPEDDEKGRKINDRFRETFQASAPRLFSNELVERGRQIFADLQVARTAFARLPCAKAVTDKAEPMPSPNALDGIAHMARGILRREVLPRFVARATKCLQQHPNINFDDVTSVSFLCGLGFALAEDQKDSVGAMQMLQEVVQYRAIVDDKERENFGCALLEKANTQQRVRLVCSSIKRDKAPPGFFGPMVEFLVKELAALQTVYEDKGSSLLSLSMQLSPEQCQCPSGTTIASHLSNPDNFVVRVKTSAPTRKFLGARNALIGKRVREPTAEPPTGNEQRGTRVYRLFSIEEVYQAPKPSDNAQQTGGQAQTSGKAKGKKKGPSLDCAPFAGIKQIRQLFQEGLPCQDVLEPSTEYVLTGRIADHKGEKAFFIDPCSFVRVRAEASDSVKSFLTANSKCQKKDLK